MTKRMGANMMVLTEMGKEIAVATYIGLEKGQTYFFAMSETKESGKCGWRTVRKHWKQLEKIPDKYVKLLRETREQIWQDSKTIEHDFFRMIVRLIQWRQLRDAMIPYLGRCENKYVPEVMCELHCKDLRYWTCYERGTTVEEDDEFDEEGVDMELREVASWIVKTVTERLVSVGLWNKNKLTVEVDPVQLRKRYFQECVVSDAVRNKLGNFVDVVRNEYYYKFFKAGMLVGMLDRTKKEWKKGEP
jgi:hypothetical protein